MDGTRAKVVDLDLNDILPNRFQPRIKFNEDSIIELSESIKEHGVIQPVVVRPIGDKYEIIAGERRYKASVLAGKDTIPAIITNLNDKDSAEVALIENVQRRDLTPIEEAISYKKILDMGYLTQEQLAVKLGKSQSTIANKVRLLNLCDEGQEALMEDKISERHARSLLRLENFEQQKEMLKKIIDERLTVRKTDEEIDKMNGTLQVTSPTEEKNESAFSPFQPGFVDVDKIANQAEDINIDQSKEVDFASLLSGSSTSPVTENPNTVLHPEIAEMPQEEEAISEIPMTPISEELPDLPIKEEEDPINQEIEEVEPFIAPMTDEDESDSFGGPIPVENVVEEEESDFVPIPPAELEQEEKRFSFADLLAGPNEEEPVEKSNEISPATLAAFENPEFIPVPLAEPVEEEPEPVVEVDEEMPTTAPIEQSIPKMTPITPIIEQPLPSKFFNFEEEKKEEESDEEGAEEKVIPVEEEEKDVATGGSTSHLSEEVRPIIITDYSKQYDPVLPDAPIQRAERTDFKDIINMIRDMGTSIERAGYSIETEEYDLADSYQVMFKIDKK